MGHVRLEGVGKAYRRYQGRWARLAEWLDPLNRDRHEKHWVLRGTSFEIPAGESVGIVGQNSAGKSTLLKIITGTTRATEGTVEVAGRIAALLELGMGFHGDFTGRQNVSMAGQLLGYTSSELLERMDEIEAFAEIGDYIDQPVRTYSSGMQMRLAFSVATAVRPDVLIVDEALAVGDVYFQQKCYERIKRYVEQGTTLLFVSHSTSAVLNLCERAILLSGGRMIFDGPARQAMDLYQSEILLKLDERPQQITVASAAMPVEDADVAAADDDASPARASEPGSLQTPTASLAHASLFDERGRSASTVLADRPVRLEVAYDVHERLADPHVGFKVRDRFGVVLYETNTYCMKQRIGPVDAGQRLVTRFDFEMRVAPGEYTITLGLANGGYDEGLFREALAYTHGAMSFAVVRDLDAPLWSGLVNLAARIDAEIVPAR